MPEREPVVFIVQEVLRRDAKGDWVRAHNLLPARKFGRLEILLDQRRFPLSTAPIVEELQEKLQDYQATDYLLPVGSPSFIMAVGAIAALCTGGVIRILTWDRASGEYVDSLWDLGGRND